MKKRTIKKKSIYSVYAFFCVTAFSACAGEKDALISAGGEGQKKIHDDIAVGNIRCVNISGNARSIVIKQSDSNRFEFINADLDTDNKYEISCEEKDNSLNVCVMMDNADSSNNILGSIVICIPSKELEKIETTGEFNQIHLNTLNSDVWIQANRDSAVVLDLMADQLDHNIMLDGLESNTFRNVSVYFDKLPDNIKMEFNTIPNSAVNVPEDLFKEKKLERGSGEPMISINNADAIDFYIE
ncbi:MAG: hypothetical protein ACLUL2_24785 [Blautia sp.]